MKKYIYLDWNVIQYLKQGVKNDKFDAPKFALFMNEISERYVFPISEGHLMDLAVGFSEDKRHYVIEDLNFITKLSKSTMLGVLDNEKLMPVQANISSEFEKILKDASNPVNINVSGSNVNIDMSKLSKESLFRPLLEKNNGVLDQGVMKDFIEMMRTSMDEPIFYRKFRDEIAGLKANFNNNNTVLDQNSDYFKRLEVFLNFSSIKDIDILESKFDEVLSSFLSIDNRNINELTKGEKIEITYMLLDFHPEFRDKINNKNKPDNMYRDCKNFFFASDAKYYVTEDEATYKKSKFTAKVLKLQVKVIKMDKLRLNLTLV